MNGDYIKKRLDIFSENTMFCVEESTLTNEEVDKLNSLPEDIKRLIVKYSDDQYKDGYTTGWGRARNMFDI